MKKTLLSLAVLLGTGLNLFASPAGEARLMKMVPADAPAAVFLNYEEWENAPAALALKDKKSPRTLHDVDSVAVWYRESDGLFVVLAAMKKQPDLPAIRKMIEEVASSNELAQQFKLEFTPVQFGKNPAWNAVAQGSAAMGKSFSFFMTALPGNILLFAEDSRAAQQALTAVSGGRSFQMPEELKGSLRAVSKMQKPIPGIPPQMLASLSLTGAKKSDLKGYCKAVCNNAEEAAQLMMQTSMLIQFSINSWFRNDFQLGSELFRALQFANQKEAVTLNFTLPQALLERIAAYSGKQAQEVISEQEKGNMIPDSGKKKN